MNHEKKHGIKLNITNPTIDEDLRLNPIFEIIDSLRAKKQEDKKLD